MQTKQEISKKSYKNRTLLLISVPLLLIIISILIYFYNLRYISTDDAYVKIAIIDIKSQVNGLVEKVNVNNNQKIKKDDVIFVIDQTLFLIKYNLAKANLDNVRNQINSAKLAYKAKVAEVESAQIDLIYHNEKYQRVKTLYKSQSIAKSEYDLAKKEYDVSLKNLDHITNIAKSALENFSGNIDFRLEEHPLYLEAKSKLDQAQFDLNNTIIKAPCDGAIANFYLKSGSYVNISIPLFSFIDEGDIWIEANFKETQLTNIEVGQSASVIIDTYPDHTLKAIVESITNASGSEFSILPAQNSSGNWVKVAQRIMVKLRFKDQPNIHIASGMSANVKIDIKNK